jgi:glutamyl-tRNA synthetase
LRGEIYRQHVARLLEEGHAFRCFCTPERLAESRQAQQPAGARTGYDGRCLGLSPAEVEKYLAESVPYVVRMKVPEQGVCEMTDLLRGRIEIGWNMVDMQVLLKQDDMPTYHLANVVDDHLMGITHVIRGEEWISSTPKHVLLYEYFGWEKPIFCHLPLLRNPDKSKLSKRKNPTSIVYYQRMGFLPEAMLNYLGLMAWSMPEGEEKLSLAEMVEKFDLQGISLGGPVFDIKKLAWLNGRWLRENLSEEEFARRVETWALNREYLMPIYALARARVSVLSDLMPLTAFFFSGEIDVKAEQLEDKKMGREVIANAFTQALETIDVLPEWNHEAIGELFKQLSETFAIKLRDFLRPFYVAIAGSATSTPLFDSMEILGRDLCRARLRRALDMIKSPVSKP